MNHRHHIIPIYRCREIGIDPNFPDNIIEITERQHVAAHWDRFKRFGRREDLWAVNMLLGRLGKAKMTGKLSSRKGIKHTAEARKKMSALKQGKKNNRYGKKLSEKHRQALILGNKTRIVSAETRKKMSLAKKGKKLSVETRRKMSVAQKRRQLQLKRRQNS